MTKNSSVRGFTTKELIVTGIVLLLIVLPLYDAVYNSPYKARALTCQSELRQIGQTIKTYQAEHDGKAPADFHTLIAVMGSKSVFVCPLSGVDASPMYLERSYTCQFFTRPDGNNALCWDSGPHHPMHSVFFFLNKDNRDVLYGDGRVKTLSEKQFQRLRLHGQNVIISPH